MGSRNQSHEQSPVVEGFVNSTKEKAEAHIKQKFPAKIHELNSLLESEDFNIKNVTDLHEEVNVPVPDALAISRGVVISPTGNGEKIDTNDHISPTTAPSSVRGTKRKRTSASEASSQEKGQEDLGKVQGTKVLALTSGPVNCNNKITRLIDLVKPNIRELVEDSNLLKMWITFLIPKIEDGNNFGVSIQEDTLGEIRTVEAEAAAFYEQISRYYMGRGKIISKVCKYPHVGDYRRLIDELDEKEFLSLRIVLSEVRNHYAALYDLITKNMEKIVRPRSSNTENLY